MLCCHLVGPNTCNCEKYSEFGHIICFRDTCLPRECWRNMISCSLLKLPRLSGLIKFLNSIHYLTDLCIFVLNWSCNFQSLFKFYSSIVFCFHKFLCNNFSSGNLLSLNNALEKNEAFFIKCGIYLILEKLKIITYRNLFKKV